MPVIDMPASSQTGCNQAERAGVFRSPKAKISLLTNKLSARKIIRFDREVSICCCGRKVSLRKFVQSQETGASKGKGAFVAMTPS